MRGLLTIWVGLLCVPPLAGADWLTDGGNSQRTAWQQDEKVLSVANVKNMKLLWKLHLDNQPRQMHSLFPPLIVGRVNTTAGVKQIAIEAGVSDNIFAIDVETGRLLWKKHFTGTWTPPAPASIRSTPLPGTACCTS